MTRHLIALTLCVLAVAARPRPAHAIAACNNNEGWGPAEKAALPVRARVVYYTDNWRNPTFVATLDGKKVALKVTDLPGAVDGNHVVLLEVDSDKTGALRIGIEKEVMRTYTITKKAAMPKELPVVIGRFQRNIPHSTVREVFDGLALRLPAGTPAVAAHVKLRRDAQSAWTEIDAPVLPQDFDDPRPVIRIGSLGCTTNYGVAMLASGVDIDVTITLADGTTRPAKDLAVHLQLPAVLPKQPTMKRP